MSKQIEQLIASCELCRLHRPSLHEETMFYESATAPFQAVSLDLCQYGGHDWLVMVDRYSNYTWVERLHGTATVDVTNRLQEWFQEFGYPATIVSDNGPQFRQGFKDYCLEHSIVHTTSSPYNPTSNGLAEQAVKTAKSLLEKSTTEEDFRNALQSLAQRPYTQGQVVASRKIL